MEDEEEWTRAKEVIFWMMCGSHIASWILLFSMIAT